MSWTMTDTDSIAKFAPKDLEVAAAMHAKLQEHYPGHQWATSVDHRTGMAHVKLLYLDKEGINGRWGFQLHLGTILSDAEMKWVVRAGGELLERFRLARGPATTETEAIARANGLDFTR